MATQIVKASVGWDDEEETHLQFMLHVRDTALADTPVDYIGANVLPDADAGAAIYTALKTYKDAHEGLVYDAALETALLAMFP